MARILSASGEVSFQTVLNAMRKNGLEKVKGQFLDYGSNEPTVGCALGQAAWNLHTDPDNLAQALDDAIDGAKNVIFTLNDNTEMTLAEIADFLEQRYADELDTVISF